MLRLLKILLIVFLITTTTAIINSRSPTDVWQAPVLAKSLQQYINYKQTFFKSKTQILTELLPLFSAGNWQLLYRYVYNSKGHNADFVLRKRSTCIIIQVEKSSDIDKILRESGKHAEGLQNKGLCLLTCAVGINIPFDWSYSPIQVQGFGRGCDLFADVIENLLGIYSYQQLLSVMQDVVIQRN